MAEFSGFFDAHLVGEDYDRIYLAEDFAKYFANFVGNGIFGKNLNELVVYQKDVADMSVKVLSGQAFINGYRYENDDELPLAIDVADGVLNRIDAIVVRWDKTERIIRAHVKKGVPATNPSAPILERSDDYYELKLANVYIKAGATSITQSDITDTRSDLEVCGFASTIADKDLANVIKTANQLETDIINLKVKANAIEKVVGYESAEYPGCYYRNVDGVIEWINPPMTSGSEYRTTERYDGKPVFIKRLYVAKMTNATSMTVNLGAAGNKIISVEGYMYDTVNAAMNLFPHVKTNVVNTSAALGSVNSSGRLTIYVAADLTTFECYVTVKYIK